MVFILHCFHHFADTKLQLESATMPKVMKFTADYPSLVEVKDSLPVEKPADSGCFKDSTECEKAQGARFHFDESMLSKLQVRLEGIQSSPPRSSCTSKTAGGLPADASLQSGSQKIRASTALTPDNIIFKGDSVYFVDKDLAYVHIVLGCQCKSTCIFAHRIV